MATDDSCKHFAELDVSRRSGLLHIHFQRRWLRRTIYELMRALDLASTDAQLQVVGLSGHFSVGCGGDTEPLALKQGQENRRRQLGGEGQEQQEEHSSEAEEQYIHEKAANFVMRSLAKKMLAHRKLLVAFVETECLGLGLSVCSLCDLVFATESAAFVPALGHLDACTKVGPGWMVPHIHWLLHLGDRADARTALHCGLLAGMVGEPQQFWHRMDRYAVQVPSAALLATKRLVIRPWRDALLKELREEGTPMAAQRRRLLYVRSRL
ncbi:uncharacterized protein LOC108138432 [Drosophila elegans]|uniref:uncharacterized protein LOC108138432 n=1 Tax=Drosophila elegans TaxID=30023 RepID=UPI0007E82451|nr:uncharacterized protein LOC108138432 [Drosophila elegans]